MKEVSLAILDIFSKRGTPLPDVFVYDKLPRGLRVQLVHIVADALGTDFSVDRQGESWRSIASAIAKEHELLSLNSAVRARRLPGQDDRADCLDYILQAPWQKALDMLEHCLKVLTRNYGLYSYRFGASAESAVTEVNQRFRMHGIGYQFESGTLTRVDSEYLHSQAIVPALALLSDKRFAGANKEFLEGHEHYRHGRYEDAVLAAAKAFESVMKSLCKSIGCEYLETDSAKKLINRLLAAKLLPPYAEEHLNGLEKCLLGLPILRNKEAGHGAGVDARHTPLHYATYALHLAASNIIYLVQAANEKGL